MGQKYYVGLDVHSLRAPGQVDHRFRIKPNTDSGPLEHPERGPVAGPGDALER